MDALNHLIDTDAIQVEVTVRLGRTRQTVAQLSALRPDDMAGHGNLLFVLPEERAARAEALLAAGALTVVESWQELADLVLPVVAGRAGVAR